jgi:hypothetical protein
MTGMGFIERIPSGSGDLHPTFLSIKASPYDWFRQAGQEQE